MTKLYLALLLIANMALAEPQNTWQISTLDSNNSLRGSAIYQQTLWVSGSNNGVFRSTDQGQSWANISVNAAIITDFRDIEVFDHNTAIVMGVGSGTQSRLYQTLNAGHSWHLLYINPDPQGFFNSIAFWDRNNGLLLGDPVDGFFVIKKTTDGGKTWTRIKQQHLPKIAANESAFSASGNTLIVGQQGKAWFTTGGFNASVYRSIDHGETWHRDSVPLHQTSQTSGGYALALNSKQQLFVLGGDYKKRDGSYNNIATKSDKQWTIPASPNQGLRTAMACIGHECLNTGKLFSDISHDHGSSWQSFSDHGFYTLAASNNIFLAAGHDGRIGVITIKTQK